MAGPAENLKGEGLVHAARTFLQKAGVVLLRVGDSAECSAETDADAVLRIFARVGNAGVVECHFRGGDGELRVTVEPFQTMRRKMVFGDPVDDLSGAMSVELRCVKTRDCADTALLRAEAAPEIFAAGTDAGDRTDSGNDGAT